MARPVKYSDAKILNATASEVIESGLDGASVAKVAKRLGAPSGSVYHRYASRRHLLGALWVRTLRRFYDALEAATAEPTAFDLADHAVAGVFEWMGQNRSDADLLARFETEDLLAGDWPTEVRLAVAEQNQRLADITNRIATARSINPLDAIMALVDFPTAAARRAHAFDNDVVTDAIRTRTTTVVSTLLS